MKKVLKAISITFDVVLTAVVLMILISGNGEFMDYFFAVTALVIEIPIGIWYRRREERRNKGAGEE